MAQDRGYTLAEMRAYHDTLRFPRLSKDAAAHLANIEPSMDRDLHYYPCAIELLEGASHDFVYLVEARSWLEHWGPPPYRPEDPNRAVLDVSKIISLRESPNRLPVSMANKLYEAGETGMGYTIFTVVFRDGLRLAFGTGNAVDFIQYPKGKSACDVEDVLPHVGRGQPGVQPAPKYVWAPFERGKIGGF
jgi:hypothetical protein